MISSDLFEVFQVWLDQHNPSLAVPLEVISREPDQVLLKFAGMTVALVVMVIRYEVVIEIRHEGICWDIVGWYDCDPKSGTQGVFCGCCPGDERVIFPDYAALFADHLFAPLADWIRDKLAPKDAIGFGGAPDGGTWARLVEADYNSGYRWIVPLR